MYNLIYTVPFKDINNNDYTIEISEDGGTASPIELTGGVSPFIIEYNDEPFLYTPTRLTGVTIKLVGGDYLQKLYSTEYQKFKVNLKKGSNILWTGFITPEVYSQDYSNNVFELEIECISALATLEYIDFKKNTDTLTLMELLKDCISKSQGDYIYAYIPSTYSLDLQMVSVSTSNFVDEDGKPMTYKEILEAICIFLNWTITEYENKIYFIDVDYVSKGYTEYKDILSRGFPTVILSNTIKLQDIQSMGASNTLTIVGGYNKAVVIDSDYELDNERLFPELKFTAMGGINKVEKVVDNETMYQKWWCFQPQEFKFYYYTYYETQSGGITYGNWRESNQTEIDNDINHDLAGVYPVKTTNYSIKPLPNSIDFTDEFELHQNWKTKTDVFLYDNLISFKMIETKFDTDFIIIDSDYKLAINFEIGRCVADERLMYDVKQLEVDDDDNADVIVDLPVELKFGEFYYNGESWQTESCTFKIPAEFKLNDCKNLYKSCTNTNNLIYHVSELQGYLIHIDRILQGTPTLTIYNPKERYKTNDKAIKPRSYFLKNIEIQCQKIGSSDLFNKQEKKDTKYENVINEDYINQCDDITFYITSKNDSELSFSKAMYNNAILDTIQNKITDTQEKPEKLMIQRIVNQYQQPKIRLTQMVEPMILPYSIVTDDNLSGKKLLFNGGTIDYYNNTANYKLLEIN